MQALGAPVVRAMRCWGGYAPTPTYRLVLQDGRRAFFKGVCQTSSDTVQNALLAEERAYQELSSLLSAWMPHFYASVHVADWHILLLEDLGPRSVPPWTPRKTRAITHALAAFHRSSSVVSPPSWLPVPADELASESWSRTASASQDFQHIAALAGDAAPQALAWLHQISPTIERAMQNPILMDGPYAIVHGDLRSDNLRFRQGQLYLFDWPYVALGRPEWDIVGFAQSVTVEGGPLPEQVMYWYEEQFPLTAEAVEASLAWFLTFFALRAWQPDIPGLPRLRRFQRQQLGVLIAWATRHWSFPSAAWAERLLA
jgi:fructosamine-3-kinase